MTSDKNLLYCVYLTVYRGSELPMFYIGSSSVARIDQGYHGSISSKQYMAIYKIEVKRNPHLFKTIIIKRFETRIAALEKELKLQKYLKVVKSPMYMNRTYALPNGFCGRNVAGSNNPNFGRRWTDEQRHAASIRNKGRTFPNRKPPSAEVKMRAASALSWHNRGKIVVKDANNTISRVDMETYLSDPTLEHHTKGTKTILELATGRTKRIRVVDFDPNTQISNTAKNRHYKDSTGKSHIVTYDDPRVISGELVMFSKGTIPVRDKNGNKFRVSRTDPRYQSGELVHQTKGTASAFDAITNQPLGRVACDDLRWKTGTIVGTTSCKRNIIAEDISENS